MTIGQWRRCFVATRIIRIGMTYTVFVLYQALPAWLSLSREQRSAVFQTEVLPVFSRYQAHVSVRLFDSEAFHAQVSDILLVTCDDLHQYYYFMEALRDTSLFSRPYILVKDVIVALEDGFRSYEAQHQP